MNSVWILTYAHYKPNTPRYEGISGVFATEELALERARKRVKYYGNDDADRDVKEEGNVVRLRVESDKSLHFWTAVEYEVQGE